MPKRKNLVGKQFDELTVVEMLYNYQNKHRTYCRCIGINLVRIPYTMKKDDIYKTIINLTSPATTTV